MRRRSLLICDYLPHAGFGTAHRVGLLHDALKMIGECRILYLCPDPVPDPECGADYTAPAPVRHDTGRFAMMWRRFSGADFRRDGRYDDLLTDIRAEYPFDLAVCSFFRNSVAAPVDVAPCVLDADAIDPLDGPVTRLARPLALRSMRRRAERFRRIYVIREADRELLGDRLAARTQVLPGMAMRVSPRPASGPRRSVLFVGPMWWMPNRRAVEEMIAAGLPGGLHRRGYRLRLVGAGTERYGEGPGLSGAGFVDDLAAEYADAELVLCPARINSGANIKLAEALQHGCAVLASETAARAYEGVAFPDRDLARFSERDGVLASVMTLLDRPDRLAAFRANASALARTILDPQRATERLARDLEQVLAEAA